MDYKERFFSKVNKDGPTCEHHPELGPCWLWTGGTNGNGYGVCQDENGKRSYVHRISWRKKHGKPVPKGKTIDHLCRTRLCVRPSHLQAVSLKKNIRRALPYRPDTKKAFCKRGHPLSGDNVRLSKDGKVRNCRACAKLHDEEARRRRGARPRGTFIPRHNFSLTDAQVRKIRKLYSSGRFTQKELAVKFEVSQMTISRCVRKERYAEV